APPTRVGAEAHLEGSPHRLGALAHAHQPRAGAGGGKPPRIGRAVVSRLYLQEVIALHQVHRHALSAASPAPRELKRNPDQRVAFPSVSSAPRRRVLVTGASRG